MDTRFSSFTPRRWRIAFHYCRRRTNKYHLREPYERARGVQHTDTTPNASRLRVTTDIFIIFFFYFLLPFILYDFVRDASRNRFVRSRSRRNAWRRRLCPTPFSDRNGDVITRFYTPPCASRWSAVHYGWASGRLYHRRSDLVVVIVYRRRGFRTRRWALVVYRAYREDPIVATFPEITKIVEFWFFFFFRTLAGLMIINYSCSDRLKRFSRQFKKMCFILIFFLNLKTIVL